MQKYLLTSLLTIACLASYAQKAVVKVKFIAATQKQVDVLLPVDGTSFYPARTTKEFADDSVLLLNFDAENSKSSAYQWEQEL